MRGQKSIKHTQAICHGEVYCLFVLEAEKLGNFQ